MKMFIFGIVIVNFKDRFGTAEYYHQDQVYWKDRGYKSDKMLSCMIPLETHSIQNAGLKLFAGSHKLGFIKHDPFVNINGLCKFMINQKRLDNLNRKYKLIVINVEPGDILFSFFNRSRILTQFFSKK